MKRVLRDINLLPINSTLNNITMPYLAISKLQWIRDPMNELPQSDPFTHSNLERGRHFRPDSYPWVSRTCPLLILISFQKHVLLLERPSTPFGFDLPANIGFDDLSFTYGRVAYVAGAARLF